MFQFFRHFLMIAAIQRLFAGEFSQHLPELHHLKAIRKILKVAREKVERGSPAAYQRVIIGMDNAIISLRCVTCRALSSY